MASLSLHCQACEDEGEKMEYPTYIYQVPNQYSSEGTKTRVINVQTKQHFVVLKEQFT